MKFVHFKSSEPISPADVTVYKSSKVVENFILNPSIDGIGSFTNEHIEILQTALSQLNSRSAQIHASNQQTRTRKQTLEDIEPSKFINFNESKDFLMSLMDKSERYKHHINVVDTHLKRKNEKGESIKSTPASLHFNRFPTPFLSDDADFIQKYNKIIEDFQEKTMNLMLERLSSRVSIIDSKLAAIKVNLVKSGNQDIINESFKSLEETTAKNLADRFRTSLEKVYRSRHIPFTVGYKQFKRSRKVNFSPTSTTAVSSLNSSQASVSSSFSTSSRGILKNNSQPSSNRNSTASHHPSKHRQNHHPSSSHRKTSHSYNKSSFNPYSTQTN